MVAGNLELHDHEDGWLTSDRSREMTALTIHRPGVLVLAKNPAEFANEIRNGDCCTITLIEAVASVVELEPTSIFADTVPKS